MTRLTTALLGIALAAMTATAAAPAALAAGEPEVKQVTIAVPGKALLQYLPLTIAERKGYFKDAGLDPVIQDFRGGSQALLALIGGSTDVVCGAFEHTIRMQARGLDVRAVIELNRLPGLVAVVRKSLADKVTRPGDLKGMKIGITAPGSSTHLFMTYLLAKDGVRNEDVAFIGVGGGASAIAAMRSGEIDALVNVEPTITVLSRDNLISVLADGRTEAGTVAMFGAPNPAAALYAKTSFLEKNPNTSQALVTALYRALKWLQTATPEDIAAVVPEEFIGGDRAIYLEAVKNSLPSYSQTGVVTPAGLQAALELLKLDKEIAAAKDLDPAKTFDDRFIKQAQDTVK